MTKFLKFEAKKQPSSVLGVSTKNMTENNGYIAVNSIMFHDPKSDVIILKNGKYLEGSLSEPAYFDKNPLVEVSRQSDTPSSRETVLPGIPGQKALVFSEIGNDNFFSKARVDLFPIVGWRISLDDDCAPPSPVMLGFSGNPRHVISFLVNVNGTVLARKGAEFTDIASAIRAFQSDNASSGTRGDAYEITYGVGFKGIGAQEVRAPVTPPKQEEPRRGHLPPQSVVKKSLTEQKAGGLVF